MTLIDILEHKYQGAVTQENCYVGRDQDGWKITYWAVPNEEQPSIAELEIYGQQNERAINLQALKRDIPLLIENYVFNVARSKDYGDAVSLASYVNSTNLQWKAEAEAFVLWRDQVWESLYDLYSILSEGADPVPSIEAVMQSLPVITWPQV